VILPKIYGTDFLLYCQQNPKPCPLIEVIESSFSPTKCASDSDIRTDLPKYKIFEEGLLKAECEDISDFVREK